MQTNTARKVRTMKKLLDEGAVRNTDGKVPTTFFNERGDLCVSAEDGRDFADYYGEFRGEYPWIQPELEAFAKQHGGFWEWQNAACLVFTE